MVKNTTRKPVPAFDFTAVEVEDTERPKTKRESTKGDNPMTPLLAATYEAFTSGEGATGKSIVIPDEQVGRAKYLIRDAAKDLGIGSRVATESAGKGLTRVTFAGKDRKAASNK